MFCRKITHALKIPRIGFATQTINVKGKFSQLLAKAINKVKNNTNMKKACEMLATTIAKENGIKTATVKILKYLA